MNWGSITIGLIGGFVLAVITNIFTDPIRNWLARRSLIYRGKRASQLREELKQITSFYQKRELFYLHLFRSAFRVLLSASFAILPIGFLIGHASLINLDRTISGVLSFWPVMPELIGNIVDTTMVLLVFLAILTAWQDIVKAEKEINAVIHYEEFRSSAEERIAEFSKTNKRKK